MADQRAVTVPAYRHRAPADQVRGWYWGVLVELGFVGAALVCYLVVRAYTDGRTAEAVAHAREVISLERSLGVDWEHAVQDATLAVAGLGPVITQVYVWGYFPVVAGVLVWLYVRHRDSYRTMRNALLTSGVIGLVVYAVYPCAPPWIGGEGYTDTVSQGAFYDVARPAGITNHLGALPSFHVGWVVLAGIVVFQVARSTLLRVLCVLHPMLMAYAVVATGNHWVLDVPAGVALAVAGLLGAAVVARVVGRIRRSPV